MTTKKVAKKIVVLETRCSECGISSAEAQLERIKGTDLYICEYCDPSSISAVEGGSGGDEDSEYGGGRQQEESSSSDYDYDYE